MIAHALRHSRWSFVALAAAATLAGCDDHSSAFAPTEQPAIAASIGVDLGTCDELAVPQGSKLVFHAYAEGVQIYQWNGATWAPRGPSATLYADANYTAKVGIHYGGPTWQSNGGSFVIGQLKTPCEVGPADIPWLLLDGVRSKGPGVFNEVASIQRVNTAGGRAPTAPGSPGEVRNVPYTAEYFFYRAP
jgi:Protein of unknown function (DUF3455)